MLIRSASVVIVILLAVAGPGIAQMHHGGEYHHGEGHHGPGHYDERQGAEPGHMIEGYDEEVMEKHHRYMMEQGGMHTNMGMMSDLMRSMNRLMTDGDLNPEKERRIAGMLMDLSRMLQEMRGPRGYRMMEDHRQHLLRMQQDLDRMM